MNAIATGARHHEERANENRMTRAQIKCRMVDVRCTEITEVSYLDYYKINLASINRRTVRNFP